MAALKTLNIEAGLPTIDEDRRRLLDELRQAKQSGIIAVKIIHRYGSTGKGGALRGALGTSLLRRKKEGLVTRIGEKWSVFEEDARYAIERCPELHHDRDLHRSNEGITIAVLSRLPRSSPCGRLTPCRILKVREGGTNPMTTAPVMPRTNRSSARRVLLGVVALFVLLYILDFAWYELRTFFPQLGQATGSVHRIRLLAIPSKGNKTEYEIDAVHPEEDVPCSHSIFPHSGNRPCWYMVRHANDPISM